MRLYNINMATKEDATDDAEKNTDKYGFLHQPAGIGSSPPHTTIKFDTKEDTPSQLKTKRKTENGRIKKWQHMLHPDNWLLFHKGSKKHKLKSRVRKGIPNAVRGTAWYHLSGANALQQQHSSTYYNDFQDNTRCTWKEQILLDVDRTFPTHIMFQTMGGSGQKQLLRILCAYSLHDKQVGYCQGIGFIAAFLLTYMEEEHVFWVLVALMRNEPYNMYGLYIDGMPKTLCTMGTTQQLIMLKNPKLGNHLKQLQIEGPMFMTGWIMTLFTSEFSFDYVVRFFDVYCSEGGKLLYRMIMALLFAQDQEMCEMDYVQTLKTLQRIPSTISDVLTPDQLLKKALLIKITTKEVRRIEKEQSKN